MSGIELAGRARFRITGAALEIHLGGIVNRNTGGSSGTLSVKVWAHPAPYTGGAPGGHELGGFRIAPLPGGARVAALEHSVPYRAPPVGLYYTTLTLEEYDSSAPSGWIVLDSLTFGGPDPIGTAPDPAPGNTPLRLEEQAEQPASRFGTDLVEEARAGRLKRPSFRETETDALKLVLTKAGRNAACLIGEPGVGKTAVVEGLAFDIAHGDVPEALRDARILDVNLSFLGAGASLRGEFEARVKELVEMARADRKIILFLDELHTVRASSNDASQMLKSDLGRGRISCIGATTTSEWRQLQADPALERRFEVVQVNELSAQQATEILRHGKEKLEQHHNVVVPDALLAQIVELSVRYLRDKRLPDKATDVLDTACARVALAPGTGAREVTYEDVCQVLASRTGLPPESISAGGLNLRDSAKLLAALQSRITGQDAVLQETVRALARRARFGARNGDTRPLWSALFAGPSGVGKTQLAKELAQAVFGDRDQHLIYIDLSDFRDEHTVSRLVGAPPGYVGFGQGGELTNALRRVATGVLLFDEIEKAHPRVLSQVLIGLLGEGIVKDMNDGREFDVTEFIVILTSNLGTARQDELAAQPGEDQTQRIRRVVEDQLPHEIKGRINDLLVFSPLSADALRRIWDREVDTFSEELADGQPSIHLRIAPEASAFLLEQLRAQAVTEGARAVKKHFDKQVATPCLDALGHASAGGYIIIERAGSGIVCRFAQEAPAPVQPSIQAVNLR